MAQSRIASSAVGVPCSRRCLTPDARYSGDAGCHNVVNYDLNVTLSVSPRTVQTCARL